MCTGIQSQARRRGERIANVHRKARQEAEEQVKQAQAKLDQQQRELQSLRERLKVLQHNNIDSPVITKLNGRSNSEGELKTTK